MIDSCNWVVTKVKLAENDWLQNKPSFLKFFFFFVLLTVCQNILAVENGAQCPKKKEFEPKIYPE